MSTTPDHPHDPSRGDFPPPPPPASAATPRSTPPPAGPPTDHGPGPAQGGYGRGGYEQGGYGPGGYGQGPGGYGQGHGGYGQGHGPGGYGPGGPGGYGQGGYAQGGYGGAGQPPYTPGGHPPTGYGPGAPLAPSDQRIWAVVSHLGGVFVSFFVPLVIWLVFRGRGAYLEDQAKEALNFQITLFIGYVIGSVTLIILVGVLILPLVWLFGVVMAIVAAVASSRGEPYRYPLTVRLIS